MFENQRTILRSFWTQALVWGGALAGYHFLMAAIRPKTGVVDGSTFPLYAAVDPAFNAWVIAPVLIFAGWLLTLHWLSRRKSPSVPVMVAIAFVIALNVTTPLVRGGVQELWRPFTRIQPEAKAEYLADVSRVDPSPLAFVRHYTELVPTLSLHAGTHPPGPVLYLWAVSRLLGHGVAVAALSAIIGTALSIYPFSLLARALLGPAVSLVAVAMYAVTPTLVLFGATSMDGVFVFFPLLATYFFHQSRGQNPIRYSILTGLTLAAAMFFTFATVCVGLVFTIEAILSVRTDRARRIWCSLFCAGLTFCLTHWLLWVLTGYNVIRAFETARRMTSAYRLEMYPDLTHFLIVSVANLAAFLIGVGVITVALWGREIVTAWASWRERKAADLLTMAVAVAVVLIAFSTIFCIETERVWMFLVPLPILAAARQLDRHQSANPRSKAWAVVLILLFTQTLATELYLDTVW